MQKEPFHFEMCQTFLYPSIIGMLQSQKAHKIFYYLLFYYLSICYLVAISISVKMQCYFEDIILNSISKLKELVKWSLKHPF